MFEINKVVTDILPTIPLRGMTVLPNVELRIEVGRLFSKNALIESESYYSGYCLLVVQNNPNVESPVSDDIIDVGIVAKIDMKIKLPNGNYKVKFKPIMRAKINEYLHTDPYYMTNFTTMPSELSNSDEEMALVRIVVNELIENSHSLLNNSDQTLALIQDKVSSEKLSDIVAYNLKMAENYKFKYLSTPSVNKRLQFLLEDIEREKYLKNIENKINQEVKKSIDENQKEYYLREKMKVIQDELGDKVNRESEVEKLRREIKDARMPKNIEEKALYELARYETLPQSSGESGVIRTYLSLVVELPWYKTTEDEKDINKAESKLNDTHFGLEKVKERIIEYLAVKILTGKNPQTILCLVGPPGVGKTSLAGSIGLALNRKFVKQSLGGVKDESEIRGHRRTYLGALPGRIIQGMKKAKVINPVFLLDEVDKLGSDYKGDPSAALLEVLDPEQNDKFSDHYLEEQYDLSQVLFIATANYLDNVPAPLRDRMEIIQLSSYTEIEKFNIAKKHLITKQLKAHGLKASKIKISEDAIYKMIRSYTREAGVRQLNRLFGTITRKAIKQILGDKKDKVVVNSSNLVEFLGKEMYSNHMADTVDQVGVVTGLAYTQFGGDTLPIEVTYYKGNGKFVLTGKLGDVMKESAQAALSYVKSNCETLGIDPIIFQKNDIHIHVPEGGVPKDGPSAGVTITTAIISAITNRKVDHSIGMTGEITLRGRILPIGGLKEKSIAAHRSGLKSIFIPMENNRDIDDIPLDVRNNLKIVPVKNISEIISKIFV